MIRSCKLTDDGDTFEWDDEDPSYRYRIRDASGRTIVTMYAGATHPTSTFNRWVALRDALNAKIHRIEMAEITASILPEPWRTGGS